jgi:hypothetical protein
VVGGGNCATKGDTGLPRSSDSEGIMPFPPVPFGFWLAIAAVAAVQDGCTRYEDELGRN